MSSVRDDIQRFYNFAMEKIQTSENAYSIEHLFELWQDDADPEPYSEEDVQAILKSYQEVLNGDVGACAHEFTEQVRQKYGLK